MNAGENKFNLPDQAPSSPNKSVDLQSVAVFANLVDVVARELGTTASNMQGVLPNGPTDFEQLVGELTLNTQGFCRTITFLGTPGQPLKVRIKTGWRDPINPERVNPNITEAEITLPSTAEKMLPQARALARHIEEAYTVCDRISSLGQPTRTSAVAISEAEIARFESQEGIVSVKEN